MISNRARLNIALTVGLLGLFAIIYMEQRDTSREDVRIADFDPAEVTTLRIERRDARPVVLVREDDSWHMRSPHEARADARRIEEIMDALSIRSHVSYPAGQLDTAGLDLDDPPLARVVVDGEAWDIGGRNPLEGWRYIRHRDTVHLANDVLYFRLGVDPAAFVSRQLLPPGATITRIALPGSVIEADGGGGWTLEPDDPGTGADALQRLVDAWRTAQALEVTAVDDTHLDGMPGVRIHLEGRDAPLEFGIERDEDSFHLHRADLGLKFRLAALRADGLTRLTGPGPDGED